MCREITFSITILLHENKKSANLKKKKNTRLKPFYFMLVFGPSEKTGRSFIKIIFHRTDGLDFFGLTSRTSLQNYTSVNWVQSNCCTISNPQCGVHTQIQLSFLVDEVTALKRHKRKMLLVTCVCQQQDKNKTSFSHF